MIVEELQFDKNTQDTMLTCPDCGSKIFSFLKSCSCVEECPHLFPSFLLTISESEWRKRRIPMCVNI